MNKITVLLYSTQLKDFVDISYILNTNLELHDKLDLTFDYSSFETINVVADQVDGFDFSKTIAVNTPCIVIFNDDIYRMYTTNTSKTVKKGSVLKYAHKVDLIEASKVLANFPVPNMTITQPQSIYAGILYGIEQNDLPFTETPGYDIKKSITNYILDSEFYTKITTPETEVDIEFNNENGVLIESPDVDILEGQILKEIGRTYNIVLDLSLLEYVELYNYTSNIMFYEHTYKVKIKHTSTTQTTLIEEFSFTTPMVSQSRIGKATAEMPMNKSIRNRILELSYTPSEVGYIHASIEVDNLQSFVNQMKFMGYNVDIELLYPTSEIFLYSKLQISTDLETDSTSPFIYLDETVDKVLNMVNAENGSSLYLTNDTRSQIYNVLSPELELQSQTAWDILEKLANYVDAVPELGLENFNSVSFTFLNSNNDSTQDITEDKVTDQTSSYNYDDYNTGYEINANNVIKESSLKSSKVEPYPSGWMTVRANEELGQITESNACFKVRQPIYKINKVFIKGVRVNITNGTTTKTLYGNYGGNGPEYSNSMWDISNWVVERQRWDTYESYTANKIKNGINQRNTTNTKGNHLYYTKGSYFVEGLGFKTSVVDNFIGTTAAPRALFETVMKACDNFLSTSTAYAGYYVELATDGDPEIAIVSGDHNLFDGVLARIEYVPLSDVRTTLIKHNFLDNAIFKTKFSNEQDRMNDTEKLGQYTRKALNKQGNEVLYITARYDNYSDIPKLGEKVGYGYSNYYITSRDIRVMKNFVEVAFELSESFVNQSSYVNVASEYRQFEVPTDNTVFRQDKYREYLIMTKDYTKYIPSQSILTQYGRRMCLDHLAKAGNAYNIKPIKYGKFIITSDTTKYFDTPINGFSIGNTVNLQVEMADNYSAGPTRTKTEIETEIAGVPVLVPLQLQKYARYTDDYGTFNELTLEMRVDGSLNNTETDADLYPVFNASSYGANDIILLNFERTGIAKDARERYGISLEFPIISDDENIVIYPGFAKYSLLIHDKDVQNIQLATTRGYYFPSINETHIDISRIHEKQYISGDTAASTWSVVLDSYSTNNNTINNYKLDYKIKLDSGEETYGYLLYEKTTGELIMGVRQYLVNNSEEVKEVPCDTLYLTHKNNLFEEWENHPASLISIFPDEPEKITITLNIGEYTTIADTTEINVYKYSKYKLAKPLKIVTEGSVVYKFLHWMTNSFDVVDDDYIFTENITLYPVFETQAKPYKRWVNVYSDYYDYETSAEVESTSCPINIAAYISPPWDFAEGAIIRGFVYRQLTEDELLNIEDYDDVILVDEGTEDERYLRPCKAQYFKAITVTI